MTERYHKSTSYMKHKDNDEENEKNKDGSYKELVNKEKGRETMLECKINELKKDHETCDHQSSNDTDKQLDESGPHDIEIVAEQRNDDKQPNIYSCNINLDWKDSSASAQITTVNLGKLSPFIQTKIDDDDDETVDYETYKPTSSKKTLKKNYPKELADSPQQLWDPKYMTSLQAGIIEAEIKGNLHLAHKLKNKLEAATAYRRKIAKANEADKEDEIMFIPTSSTGNSNQFSRNYKLTTHSEKRKAETYVTSGRNKYFGNEEKYNSNQMLRQEKYESNVNEEALLGHVTGSSQNPNDNLEYASLGNILKISDERETEQDSDMDEKIKKTLETCVLCTDTKYAAKHLIISYGTKVYMALPAQRSLVEGQCLLTTTRHSTCVTAVDEDVWEEIMYFRQMITQFFESKNYDVVFYETAARLYSYPHMVINCIPLPKTIGHMASIYFKKALLECESNWSINEKVIYLRRKNIRKGVPKRLPYFWVDFGMVAGFAHLIEDQKLFPRNFGEEIIGGMLRLDRNRWIEPQIESDDEQKKKVSKFMKEWKPFEHSFQEKPHNI